MTKPIELQIKTKISNISFSNNSRLIDRCSEIVIKGDDIGFSVDISGINITEANKIRNLAIEKLQQIPNINKINIVLTRNKEFSEKQSGKSKSSKIILENIDKIILISAGKGGVGKSTISALLAQKLASEGKKIGLLDSDIYGPSIPNIFSLNRKPELLNKRMIPLFSYNVKINSIGFLVNPESSISWRGPMTSKALYQLISLTEWGELDYLIIDTPPGTGDIHLSLLQNYLISGFIIITTPQKIAEIDVQRTINLYKKFSIAPIGIIENMSYYIPPNSSEKIKIFAGNSGDQISANYNIPLLSKIALNSSLANACDKGNPLNQYFELLNFEI